MRGEVVGSKAPASLALAQALVCKAAPAGPAGAGRRERRGGLLGLRPAARRCSHPCIQGLRARGRPGGGISRAVPHHIYFHEHASAQTPAHMSPPGPGGS